MSSPPEPAFDIAQYSSSIESFEHLFGDIFVAEDIKNDPDHNSENLFLTNEFDFNSASSTPNTETGMHRECPEKKKKMPAADIEKERRNEMNSLASALHSLLPKHHQQVSLSTTSCAWMQGKNSLCSKIVEAADYIKELENNIKHLYAQRDRLKAEMGLKQNNTKPNQVHIIQHLFSSPEHDGENINKIRSFQVRSVGQGYQVTLCTHKRSVMFSKVLVEVEDLQGDLVSGFSRSLESSCVVHTIYLEAKNRETCNEENLRERISKLMR